MFQTVCLSKIMQMNVVVISFEPLLLAIGHMLDLTPASSICYSQSVWMRRWAIGTLRHVAKRPESIHGCDE